MPDDLACRADGSGERDLNGDKLKWDVLNTGTGTITISEVSINWPESNGELVEVKFSGDVWKGTQQPPVVTLFEGFDEDPDKRRVEAGKDETLELKFADDIELDEETYSVIVRFVEGCSVEFVAFDATSSSGPSKGDKKARDTKFPSLTGADRLHEQGITGRDVGIAILDTGLWATKGGDRNLRKNASGDDRLLAFYDARNDVLLLPDGPRGRWLPVG